MPQLKYISFFDFQDSKVARNYSMAGANKMESICDALSDIGYEVEIISVSQVTEPKLKCHKGVFIKRGNIILRLFPSWGGNNAILSKIRTIWHSLYLMCYLLTHLKKGETIILYHSLAYTKIISLIKRLKQIKLILEVEEIYSDVIPNSSEALKNKEKRFISKADAYIFPTELLNEQYNPDKKPSIIIYGSYKIPEQISKKYSDGRIHIVYAGTFDSRKGVLETVDAAKYLSSHYCIHICGFGSQNDTKCLINKISEINSRADTAEVMFHGVLKGSDYLSFLQNNHIGLCPQSPESAFTNTSFPSKILSYLSNGLSVVSVDIPAIKQSLISKSIYFYKAQEPESLANAIKDVPEANPEASREIIKNLYNQFVIDFSKLINEFTSIKN